MKINSNKINFKLFNELKKYLLFLKIERNLSENTINSFWLDLNEYLLYLCNVYKINSFKKITKKNISSYINLLLKYNNNKKINEKTINRVISSIKGVHKYLLFNKIIPSNHTVHLQSIRITKKLPITLSIEEIN